MPKIGVQNLAIAQVLTDDQNSATYGAVVSLIKKLMKIGYDPQVLTAELSADNQIVEKTSILQKIKITLDATDLTPAEKALILGQTQTNGVRTVGTFDIAPYFCVMFKAKKSNGKFRYVKLLKVQFTEPKGNMETVNNSLKYQGDTLEGEAIARIYDDNIMRELDDEDANYSAAIGNAWFNSGDIATDITPPTLSSSLPANNVTGVAIGSTFVWTFSEAVLPASVKPSNFFLVKDSDGSAVAGVLTQSGDKLTVTFTPSASLTAATAYRAVCTTGVVDLSNNALATVQMRKFTTA